MKKLVKCGCDFVRGADWKPIQWTKKQALAYITKEAKRAVLNHKGQPVFYPSICDCGDYYRVCLAGQPERR